MRYWSRIFALLLCIILSIPLFSCANGSERWNTKTSDSKIPAMTLTPEPTSVSTAESTSSQTPDHEVLPITFGMSSGNSYQNEYFDIAVDLDELWFAEDSRSNDEENGIASDITEGEREQAYLDRLKSGNSVQDFYAHTHTGLKAINIRVYDYSAQDDQYPDIFMHYVSQTYQLRDVFESNGLEVTEGLCGKATIAGETQFCWYYTYEYNGIVWDCALVMMNRGDYVMNILTSSMVTKHAEEMLSLFHKVSE